MVIDRGICTGCGNCVKDCVKSLIYFEQGKACMKSAGCIDCGHCVAVCPVGAVKPSAETIDEVHEYIADQFDIPASALLNFMKFRRSVRRFKNKEIEDDKLLMLLDAGRYSPTGSNRQNVRYIILKDQCNEVMKTTLKILHDYALQMDKTHTPSSSLYYKEKWIKLYKDFLETGKDGLFYAAPCVILVVAKDNASRTSALNGGLASANIELMANALGLGACYIGFFLVAVDLDQALRSLIGLTPGESLVSALALGYPDVKYYRTVSRKRADVTFL